MQAIYVLTAIALILIPMSAGAQAYPSDVEIIDTPHVWVFVVDKSCNTDTEIMKADILSIPTYAPYLRGGLDVVCFPNAPMLELAPVVEMLKQAFPEDVFVFSYDFRNVGYKMDWRMFMVAADGRAMENGFGRAFVTEGYAVSVNSPLVIAHEATHLTLKATHPHGTDSENPASWVRQ